MPANARTEFQAASTIVSRTLGDIKTLPVSSAGTRTVGLRGGTPTNRMAAPHAPRPHMDAPWPWVRAPSSSMASQPGGWATRSTATVKPSRDRRMSRSAAEKAMTQPNIETDRSHPLPSRKSRPAIIIADLVVMQSRPQIHLWRLLSKSISCARPILRVPPDTAGKEGLLKIESYRAEWDKVNDQVYYDGTDYCSRLDGFFVKALNDSGTIDFRTPRTSYSALTSACPTSTSPSSTNMELAFSGLMRRLRMNMRLTCSSRSWMASWRRRQTRRRSSAVFRSGSTSRRISSPNSETLL